MSGFHIHHYTSLSCSGTRLMIYRIEQDWYTLAKKIEEEVDLEASRDGLKDQIIRLCHG